MSATRVSNGYPDNGYYTETGTRVPVPITSYHRQYRQYRCDIYLQLTAHPVLAHSPGE